jgi:hypothetical protein
MDLTKSNGAPTEVCFELLGFKDKTTGAAVPARDSTTPGGQNSWFFHLFNIRFVLKPEDGSTAAVVAANDAEHNGSRVGTATMPSNSSNSSTSSSTFELEEKVPVGMPDQVKTDVQMEPPQYQNFNASAEMMELERRVRAAASAADIIIASAAEATQHKAASSPEDPQSSSSSSSETRRLLQVRTGSDGTGKTCRQQQVWKHLQQQHDWPDGQVVFESLYRPCEKLSPGSCIEMCGHE